jgi:hypothetical protein
VANTCVGYQFLIAANSSGIAAPANHRQRVIGGCGPVGPGHDRKNGNRSAQRAQQKSLEKSVACHACPLCVVPAHVRMLNVRQRPPELNYQIDIFVILERYSGG